MLRVVVVDDEPLARQGLADLLGTHAGIQIVGQAKSAREAVPMLAEHKPEAVFLDIQMPGSSGFDLLERLNDPPKVVFVTAHSEYAVEAFSVQAVDYLLKPVRPERLAEAVQRLEAVCSQQEETAPYKPEDRICLRTPQRTLVAHLGDLVAIEAEGDFVRYHVSAQKPLLVYRSLSSCEKTLPAPPFLRVSRSLILNLEKIQNVDHPSRNKARLVMQGSDKIFELGRRALANLKRAQAPNPARRELHDASSAF